MNVFATSPAHVPAREARAEIEQIVGMLRESTTAFDRRGVADRLARGIRALYAVVDSKPEAPAHHDGLAECERVLGEARQLLVGGRDVTADPSLARSVEALDKTIAKVARAAHDLLDLELARRSDPRRGGASTPPPADKLFRASTAVPQLHAIRRAPVLPALTLDPHATIAPPVPPPRVAPALPSTLEELRAAAAAAASPAPLADAEGEEGEADDAPAPAPSAADDGEILRRLARDCLEDIAALRSLRKPIPTETWLDQAPFEQRLLDNIDAFAALGEIALPTVTLFHAEAPAPDPSRGFAVALTLGCIEGSDTASVAVATMRHSAPATLPGFVEGFVLAPSPALDLELAELLDAPNPAIAGVALEVLGARGTLPLDAPARLLSRQHHALTMSVARALGRALPKTRAVPVLSELLERAVPGSDEADELFAVTAASLLRRGDGDVRQRLRDAIRARTSPRRVAVSTELLAIAGRQDDAALLLEGLALAPRADTVRAIGRHGSVASLGALAAMLDAQDEAMALAAAEALDFMTGAGLRETKEIPWVAGVAPPDGSPPPTRAVSKVIVDRVVWEGWLARSRARLDPRVKLRDGAPFSPQMIVSELSGVAPPPVRAAAAFELVVATGVGASLRTDDWVARQAQQLSEIGEHVRSLGAAAGAWWYAGAGTTSR